jgi:hypothetical protein
MAFNECSTTLLGILAGTQPPLIPHTENAPDGYDGLYGIAINMRLRPVDGGALTWFPGQWHPVGHAEAGVGCHPAFRARRQQVGVVASIWFGL